MALEFTEWLNSFHSKLTDHLNDRVIVVGIIAQSFMIPLNGSPIMKTMVSLFRLFFLQAYYEPNSCALFLLLNGIYDAVVQRFLFCSKEFSDKNFFEKMAMFEMEHVHFLHFLFVICHLIVVVEQGSRFNCSIIRTLKAVKLLKQKTQNIVRRALEENCEISKSWSDEGRLASPKLIFAFNSSSMRNDLTTMMKRKEFLDKAEKSLENQIVSVLKHHRIVDNYCPESALASLPSISIPFVHIIQRNLEDENIERKFSKCLIDFFVDKSSVDLTEQIEKLQNVGDQVRNHEFCEFLRESIVSARTDNSKSKPVYKFPKLSQLIIGAKIVYRELIEERIFDESDVAGKVNMELTAMEILANKALHKAVQNYEIEMQNSGISPAVLSRQQHEQLMLNALDSLSKLIKAELFTEVMQSLRERCTKIWKNGHERCEALSLFGNMCSLPIHDKKETERSKDLRVNKRNHSSGFKFLSTCNCGKTQLIRVDPFSLKEANFDFFEQYEYFECCENLEKFQFELFEPTEESIRHHSSSSNSKTKKTEEFCSDQENDHLRNTDAEIDDQDERTNYRREVSDKTTTEKTAALCSSMSDSEVSNVEVTSNIIRPVNDESEEEDALPNPLEYNIRFFDENEETVVISDKKKNSDANDSDLEGEEEDDEEEADIDELAGLLKAKVLKSQDDPGHYLDNYDSHLIRQSPTSTIPSSALVFNAPFSSSSHCENNKRKLRKLNAYQMEEIEEKFEGKYLDFVPFHSRSSTIESTLLPLFPSWSIICVGSSRLYNHAAGLRNQPNFKPGYLPFLLPWDVYLTVKTEQWQKDVNLIHSATTGGGEEGNRSSATSSSDYGRRRQRRFLEEASEDGTNREKVKVFVGFDYECPRGHRFFIQSPTRALKFRRSDGELLMLDAGELISTELPIWMSCTCQRKPRQVAQLMRIHVVTPKAPVAVRLNPKVQLPGGDGYFHLGNGPVNLGWGKYYVLRFPFVYKGPSKIQIRPPEWPNSSGKLLANCIDVVHTQLVTSDH